MPKYPIHGSYTGEGLKGFIKDGCTGLSTFIGFASDSDLYCVKSINNGDD